MAGDSKQGGAAQRIAARPLLCTVCLPAGLKPPPARECIYRAFDTPSLRGGSGGHCPRRGGARGVVRPDAAGGACGRGRIACRPRRRSRRFEPARGEARYATDLETLTTPCPGQSAPVLMPAAPPWRRVPLCVHAACGGRGPDGGHGLSRSPDGQRLLRGGVASHQRCRRPPGTRDAVDGRIYVFFDGVPPREADMDPGGLAIPPRHAVDLQDPVEFDVWLAPATHVPCHCDGAGPAVCAWLVVAALAGLGFSRSRRRGSTTRFCTTRSIRASATSTRRSAAPRRTPAGSDRSAACRSRSSASLYFAFVLGAHRALPAVGRRRARISPGYVFAVSTLGLAGVLYLAYASFFVLKTVCLLCRRQLRRHHRAVPDLGRGDQVSHDAVFPAARRATCARCFVRPRR